MTRVGVLALQGDISEHTHALDRLGVAAVRVRRPEAMGGLDGVILPGGESTTIGQLALETGLVEPLRSFVAAGKPVWGTCAGVILLSETRGLSQPLVGGLDVVVERNAFGRQVESFEADLEIDALGAPAFRAVFIRAPAIRSVGPGVAVLARLEDGAIVAVRQGNVLGTVFHPELTEDLRFHRLFLQLVAACQQRP